MKNMKLSLPKTILMFSLNYTSLVLAIATLTLIIKGYWYYAVVFLYLFPPLVARIILFLLPIKKEKIAYGSKDYFVWWALSSLQIIFDRFQILEEIIRIIPTAYSFWLRLWGSKIGRFVFWSPTMHVWDRSFLKLGNNVTMGGGVTLAPHVVLKTKEGNVELWLSPVIIEDNAVVGGFSVIFTGSKILKGEHSPAMKLIKPFSTPLKPEDK
jgi:hypothetical protein